MEPTKGKKMVIMGQNKSTRTKSPPYPIDFYHSHHHHLFKTLLLTAIAISCVIETTGLSYYGGAAEESSRKGRSSMITYGSIRHNTSSSEVSSSFERYDPVEAYHQLRRYYLSNRGKLKEEQNGQHHHYASHSHPQHHHYNSHRNGLYYNGGQGGGGGGHNHHHHQVSQGPSGTSSLSPLRCYVCLPPNKNSREARDILGMFAPSDQAKIADCSEFSQHNSDDYEFTCPATYGGCILRIHGPNISRACSRYRLNDCKKANGVEFCYCTQPLCNDVKQEPYKWPPKNTPQSHRSVNDDNEEDDDEDSEGRSSGDSENVSSSDDASDSSANGNANDSPPPPTHHSSYNNGNNEDESGEVRGPLANFNLGNNNNPGPPPVATGSVIKPSTLEGDGLIDATDSSSSTTFHSSRLLLSIPYSLVVVLSFLR